MARSWTLEATRTGSAGDSVRSRGCSDGNYHYFVIESGGNDTVYRWNQSGGFVDISGTTFHTIGWDVAALAIFKGLLYARVIVISGSNYTPYLYKYSGSGQSWTQVFAGPLLSTSTSSSAGDLEADNTRIVVINRHNGGRRVDASLDGTTWSQQTANGSNTGQTIPDTSLATAGIQLMDWPKGC